MKIRDIGEIGLIERLAKGIRLDGSVVKGIGDDTAVIRWTKDKYLLFTCDMLVEDVHFKRSGATPFEIGWKALARNVSDIAAMGGAPRYALVSAAIDPDLPVSFADGVYKGMRSLAGMCGINIVGGDTSASGRVVIDVSLIGEVKKGDLVLRSGAVRGDAILVTGGLGGSIKGRHLRFMPRLEESRSLVRDFKVHSMIDISDGLALDLRRLLKASSAGARICAGAVPLSGAARSLEDALYGGEDFELLFTMAAPEAARLFRSALPRMKTPVTLIGEVTDKRYGCRLIDEYGREKPLKPKGYLHF
ncbi:MAG: thiamine-phosphate kinase [Candidatus Omnitrophota bacterium]